jgi:hypothetical protein
MFRILYCEFDWESVLSRHTRFGTFAIEEMRLIVIWI